MIANLVLGILCLILILAIPNKGRGLVVSFVLITLFWCLRYDWGNDYLGYLKDFLDYSKSSVGLSDINVMSDMRKNSEFGWVWLNILFGKFLKVGFFGFVIALSIFENWTIYRFIKKHVDEKHYWLAVALYVFSTGIFATGASMFRQYLCIICFLWVYEWMLEKKWLPSVALILLCSTVHASNIIIFALLPIFLIRIPDTKIKTVWIVAIILFFILWSNYVPRFFSSNIDLILSDYDTLSAYSNYLVERDSSGEIGLGVIFQYAVLTYTIILLPKFDRPSQIMALLFIASYLLRPLAATAPMISRFSTYLTIFEIALWPSFLKFSSNKLVAKGLLVCLFVVMTKSFFDFFNAPVWVEKFYEYHTIFSAGSWM